jgi:hypothetical protein
MRGEKTGVQMQKILLNFKKFQEDWRLRLNDLGANIRKVR